jgi:hypothetical protein
VRRGESTVRRLAVHTMLPGSGFRWAAVAASVVVMILCAGRAGGADANSIWIVSSGNWSDANCWLNGEPNAGRYANISNGGTATIDRVGEACSYLTLGASPGQSGSVNMLSGAVSASSAYVGRGGVGAFTQVNGAAHLGDYLYLGYDANSQGTYQLQDGNLTVRYDEYVGRYGTGAFTQSGGVHGVSRDLYLGNYSGSSGTYDLQDGNLTIGDDEYIGFSGAGAFTQSGGVNGVSDSLYLGYYSSSNGTYELQDGNLTVGSNEFVGQDGNGTFLQSGGVHTTDYLKIGNRGRYVYSGGTLRVNERLDSNGVLDFAGGAVVMTVSQNSQVDLSKGDVLNAGAASLIVEANSLLTVGSGFDPNIVFGTFSNAGITHTAGTTLVIPEGVSLVLAGDLDDRVDCQGSLAAREAALDLNRGLWVSGSGTVFLGGRGKLYVEDPNSGIAGGRLDAGYEYIGCSGTGTFTQTGGDHTVFDVYLGDNLGSGGTYALGDGNLRVYGERIGGHGTGTFTQSRGDHEVLSLYLGYYSTGNGTYYLQDGNLRVQGFEYVGYSGEGTFTQSGGVHESVDNFSIGWDANSRGTYNLQDGNLRTGEACVGYSGKGTFTQSGGVHRASRLDLGRSSRGSGTYDLQDGNLTVEYDERIGCSGTGLFTQSGGLHTVSGTLRLGYGSLGAYELEGGNLFARDLVVGGSSGGVGVLMISGGCAEVDGNFMIFGVSQVHLGEGTLVDSDPNHPYLDVENSGTLYIEEGVYCLGRVQGIGDTLEGTIVVESNATLWVESIKQDSLIVEAGGTVHFAAEDYGLFLSLARENQSLVPEPGCLALLGAAGLALAWSRPPRRRPARVPSAWPPRRSSRPWPSSSPSWTSCPRGPLPCRQRGEGTT